MGCFNIEIIHFPKNVSHNVIPWTSCLINDVKHLWEIQSPGLSSGLLNWNLGEWLLWTFIFKSIWISILCLWVYHSVSRWIKGDPSLRIKKKNYRILIAIFRVSDVRDSLVVICELNNLALGEDSETKINYLAQAGPIRFSFLEIYLFKINK